MPPINWLDQVNAQKDFKLGVEGPEDLTNWFAQTLMMMQTVERFGQAYSRMNNLWPLHKR